MSKNKKNVYKVKNVKRDDNKQEIKVIWQKAHGPVHTVSAVSPRTLLCQWTCLFYFYLNISGKGLLVHAGKVKYNERMHVKQWTRWNVCGHAVDCDIEPASCKHCICRRKFHLSTVSQVEQVCRWRHWACCVDSELCVVICCLCTATVCMQFHLKRKNVCLHMVLLLVRCQSERGGRRSDSHWENSVAYKHLFLVSSASQS